MTELEQKKAAKEFADFWKDKGYEKGESQSFWRSLLSNVFGIEKPEQIIEFKSPSKTKRRIKLILLTAISALQKCL